MKIAAYLDQGRPAVGIVSSDLQSVLPLELSAADAALGALAIVELMAAGKAMPSTGAPVGMDAIQLTAPLPRPRRNLFCVGKNYHAHAREFAGSGFDSSAKSGGDIPTSPIIFTKVPGVRDRHRRAHRDPRGRLDRDRLRSRAGRGDRPGRQGHQGRRGA